MQIVATWITSQILMQTETHSHSGLAAAHICSTFFVVTVSTDIDII